EINEARTKAESLKALIDSGKTFKKIAEEHSEDPGPEMQVSEHGFVNKGVLPSEADEALFSLQQGEISEIIQSKLGLHIIEVREIVGGKANTFENAKDDAEKNFRLVRAEEHFFDLADQLATLAYEHLDTLDVASEAIGINIQESEFFSRSSAKEGIIADAKIISASFSSDVINSGNNSEVLELSDNRLVVLRVIEHIPNSVKPLEDVKEQVTSDIRFMQASSMQQKLGQEILVQLREGKAFDQIAAEKNIAWKEAPAVTRGDVSVNRAILRTAFRLGKPQGQPVVGAAVLGTGDYAVVAVTNVEDPDVFGKDIEDTKQQLEKQRANYDWGEMLDELRNGADIEIFADRI
ncbi:MAG: peptidyl-prolyl cis-trans isomerase, partial [Gammaproteobacteria bacterium]